MAPSPLLGDLSSGELLKTSSLHSAWANADNRPPWPTVCRTHVHLPGASSAMTRDLLPLFPLFTPRAMLNVTPLQLELQETRRLRPNRSGHHAHLGSASTPVTPESLGECGPCSGFPWTEGNTVPFSVSHGVSSRTCLSSLLRDPPVTDSVARLFHLENGQPSKRVASYCLEHTLCALIFQGRRF